jgi:hypothetical protein
MDDEDEVAAAWVLHARWHLGEVSDADYADAIVAGGVPEDDPLVVMLRKRDQPASD